MRLRVLPLAILLLGGLPACAGTPSPSTAPVPAGERYLRDEMYFGMRKADSTLVTEAEWQAFVDSVVTPRFPQGLTVLAAYGQWSDRGALVREPSKVLILIHQGGPDVERHIREIAAVYCRRFSQKSVMRITDPVSAEFLDAGAAAAPGTAGRGGSRGALRTRVGRPSPSSSVVRLDAGAAAAATAAPPPSAA